MINNREKVAADFREEIKHAFEPEAKILSADRELRYCLELQRARLAKRNLNCTDEMIHRGPFPNGLNRVRSWKDGHYDTSWTVDFITHNKTMQREGMKTFKQNETQSIYETVVDVHDGDDVSSDTYCCPNCGSVSTIAELQEGCAYCGTSFKMSELYPKVKNYFFVFDMSGKTDHMFKTVIRYGLYLLPFNISMCLAVLLQKSGVGFKGLMAGEKVFTGLWSILYAPICIALMIPVFGFVGWMLDCFRLAFSSLPVLFEVMGSRQRFAAGISPVCPEFTFEYFISKIVSFFKIFAYSENRRDLPFYAGSDNGEEFDDLVDASFFGTMSCKRVARKDNMVYVTGDLYMENAYDLSNRIKAKKEIFRVRAGRRTDIPFTTNFSITKIQCPSCGGSFNAFKTRSCPYCGNEYKQENTDWVIYDIQNITKKIKIKRVITWLVVVAVFVGTFLYDMSMFYGLNKGF